MVQVNKLVAHAAARRVLGAMIVAVLAAGVFVAVGRGESHPVTGAGRLEVEGEAVVTRAGGVSVSVTDAADLHDGDVVEARSGSFVLRLVGGGSLEGRAPTDRTEATRLRAGTTPEVLAGDALLVAPLAARVDAAGTHVDARPGSDGPAVVRVSRSLAVRLGVYRGAASLDSAGQERSVPMLREMTVPSLGRPPATPKPLALDHPDVWDRRYLADTIDLGQTLQSLSNAFSPTLRASEGRDVKFYETLLPTLGQVGGVDDTVLAESPTRPQGELLVGAAITALGRSGQPADRWRAVFAFRDEGATWGLVALDQAVSGGPLLAMVKDAVDRTPFQFAAATPVFTPATAGTTPDTTAPNGTTTPTTTPPNGSAPTTTAPPSTGLLSPTLPSVPPISLTPSGPTPTTTPPQGGTTNVVGGLVDAVGGLLGGLLGGG